MFNRATENYLFALAKFILVTRVSLTNLCTNNLQLIDYKERASFDITYKKSRIYFNKRKNLRMAK